MKGRLYTGFYSRLSGAACEAAHTSRRKTERNVTLALDYSYAGKEQRMETSPAKLIYSV
jgi:hypothetical protein